MGDDQVNKGFLLERLQELEPQRKVARFRAICGWFTVLVAVASFLSLIVARKSSSGFSLFWMIGGFLFWGIIIAIVWVWANTASRRYEELFKEKIVKEVIRAHNSEWKYFPKESITKSDYYRSEIFKRSVDRYKGDDLVRGFEGKTTFTFSELLTEYKTETTNSKGHKSTSWHTIFKGIFLFAEFNKEIQGKTFVFPDAMPSFLGRLGQKFQSWNKSHGDLVKLENVAFEKHFVVYSSSQIEARYILTPKIMENLVDFTERWRKKIHLSFVGQRMYFAISFAKNLFEPRIYSSGVRQTDLDEMNAILSLVSDVIAEMDLNTRIWTVE